MKDPEKIFINLLIQRLWYLVVVIRTKEREAEDVCVWKGNWGRVGGCVCDSLSLSLYVCAYVCVCVCVLMRRVKERNLQNT